MNREIITTVKLTASEGYILTNGESFGKVVFLASNDNGERWYEITEKEYEDKIEEVGLDE